MSRISLSHSINFVLLAAVLTLGWMLFQRSSPRAEPTAALVAEDETSTASSPARMGADSDTADAMAAISARLAAIDARLSAIERGAPPPSVGQAAPAPPTIAPQAAAAAERRLNAMFPDGRVDQEDMQRFQMTLATLPPDERLALTASMTQAINAARIQLHK